MNGKTVTGGTFKGERKSKCEKKNKGEWRNKGERKSKGERTSSYRRCLRGVRNIMLMFAPSLPASHALCASRTIYGCGHLESIVYLKQGQTRSRSYVVFGVSSGSALISRFKLLTQGQQVTLLLLLFAVGRLSTLSLVSRRST